MAHTAVVIMAKAPYPGQVKTRLCPPLTPWQAAWLPAWFDIDTPADLARLHTMLSETAGEEPRYTRQFFWSVREA